jgi:hypothetical protein
MSGMAVVWMLRRLLPPAKDNQRAANFLHDTLGMDNPFLRWTAIRFDTLLDGDVAGNTLHEGVVNRLFAPGSTNMANVTRFMCELVTNPKTWDAWKGKRPVIVNATASNR